jgi:hypothetical protein
MHLQRRAQTVHGSLQSCTSKIDFAEHARLSEPLITTTAQYALHENYAAQCVFVEL